jgi:hypothetical protein
VRGRAELANFTGAMVGLLPTLTIKDLPATPDRAACPLIETLTFNGEEKTCFIVGFASCATDVSPGQRSTGRAAPDWPEQGLAGEQSSGPRPGGTP